MKETIEPSIWQPDFLGNETVKLVPLTERHFEELYAVASDPLIWEQHPARDRYKREVFRTFFDDALRTNSAFVIAEASTGKVIGSTRYYDYEATSTSVAIGFTFLGRPYWGGAYNKSTKRLLLDHAFRHVDNVIFHIGADNVRSQKAILKIGAVKVKEFCVNQDGSLIAKHQYVIEKRNWKGI
jgi:RimJ/RimL family protein N-acetyltransferase